MYVSDKIKTFVQKVKERNPHEDEFLQAVKEVAEHVIPFMHENPKYEDAKILETMVEPERVIMFRVPWQDDKGERQVNRGFRVQFNSALGPYKGGLRFHPSVNLSILKFLGFEQILKNSLTTLPLGGGKGGSDFNPKGKSDSEVMRFCQSFMTELSRHIGPTTDVPAGDIGVGAREIGFLFGQYKRMRDEWSGTLTGKGTGWGGSKMRTEATGYGLIYFLQEMLKETGESIEGQTVLVSGSGNVAQHAIEKAVELGAKVVTASDSGGYVFDKDGFDDEKVAFLKKLKNEQRGRIKEFAEKFPSVQFFEGEAPWAADAKADVALPCATQNEITADDAKAIVKMGVKIVAEGANMPCTAEAWDVFRDEKLTVAPGKASNAGGVATSGIEMTQNAQFLSWTSQQVDERLHEIMCDIHDKCVKYGRSEDGKQVDYAKGANIAGFVRVADAMIEQGHV